LSVLQIKGGRFRVVQRRETYEFYAGTNQRLYARECLIDVASFVQVGYQYENRPRRTRYPLLTIRQRAVNIGSASKLRPEKNVDGIGRAFRQVDGFRVEKNKSRLNCVYRRLDRRKNRRIDDRTPHRAALVDAKNDFPQRLAFTRVTDETISEQFLLLDVPIL